MKMIIYFIVPWLSFQISMCTLVIVSNKLFYREKKLQEYHGGISAYFSLRCLNFGMTCLWQVSL